MGFLAPKKAGIALQILVVASIALTWLHAPKIQ